MLAEDSRLLGIPRWRPTIVMICPHHDVASKDFPGLSAKGIGPRAKVRGPSAPAGKQKGRGHRPLLADKKAGADGLC